LPNEFAITAAADRVTLDADRRGRAIFTVSNMTDRQLRARARVAPFNTEAAGWFSIGEPEREIPLSATQQFTVEISVPPSAPPGDYTFRLDVVGVENPDEQYAQGPGVIVGVPASLEPLKKPFPWWIVAAAGATVLVIIIVAVVLLTRDEGGGGAVILRSTTELNGGQVFDFDAGRVDDRASADLELVTLAVDNEALLPLNGARVGVFGADSPGFDGCRDTSLESRAILVQELSTGNHLCVLTSEGNLTEIRIDGAVIFLSLPPRFGTVDMIFTTFENG
jgi:hypothetical protein